MPNSILDDPTALQAAIAAIHEQEGKEQSSPAPVWKEPRVKFSTSAVGDLKRCVLIHEPSGRQFRWETNGLWYEVETL